MKLTIATSYLPVSADIRSNLKHVLRHMEIAHAKGADIVHFPEACLSGYAGVDFKSYKKFNWDVLESSVKQVLEKAHALGLWVVLGTTYRLSAKNKPHNSLYIINDRGEIINRYDKMFCAGSDEVSGDLAHYSSGNHFCIFTVKGIRCGTLICHDCRYPELYRQYKRKDVQIIFQSYHAANIPLKKWSKLKNYFDKKLHGLNHAHTLPGIIFPATIQSTAANNYLWISCSNSSAPQSCFPAFFVRPDGVMTGRLKRNISGILISTVDTEKSFYDSTAAWRDRAMNGIFNSGKLVRDKRSNIRTKI
jgi:predicted amidohydrolase